MGTNAAAALAKHIKSHTPPKSADIPGTTKAITILAKIGNDVADDKEVTNALLGAAAIPADTEGSMLQLRLAALDALGEINKYRGGILDKNVSTVFSATEVASALSFVQKLANSSNTVSEYLWSQFSGEDQAILKNPASAPEQRRITLTTALNKILTGAAIYDDTRFKGVKLSAQTETLAKGRPTGDNLVRANRILIAEVYREEIPRTIPDLGDVVEASDGLLGTAEKEFDDLSRDSGPAKPCPDFYLNLKILHESQTRMVKLAGDVSVDTSSSEKKESPFPKLADEKTLGASLKKIEIAYLDATKTIDEKKLWLKKASAKTSRQFQTESAYGLLTETRQLNTDLHALEKAVVEFKKNQDGLKELISALAAMPEMVPLESVSSYRLQKAEISGPDLIRTSISNALNQIFSKPPKKKKAVGASKKEAKKGAVKTDTDKKESDKKATGKKESDTKDAENSDEDEKDSTDDE
jgi:hypothetical protein